MPLAGAVDLEATYNIYDFVELLMQGGLHVAGNHYVL